MGSDDNIISLVRNLYNEQQSAVTLEYGTANWFTVGMAGRHGCILSPHMSTLGTENIVREVYDDMRRNSLNIIIKINGHEIYEFHFHRYSEKKNDRGNGCKEMS